MDPARPTPVVDAAKIGGLVQSAVVAVGGVVLVFYPQITGDKISQLGAAVGLAATALVAAFMYVAAIVHAKYAAAQVTPLSAPRNDQGQPLVPVDDFPHDAYTAWVAHPRSTPKTAALIAAVQNMMDNRKDHP